MMQISLIFNLQSLQYVEVQPCYVSFMQTLKRKENIVIYVCVGIHCFPHCVEEYIGSSTV